MTTAKRNHGRSAPRPTLSVLAAQKGVTQKELAWKAGMDAGTVRRMFRNPDAAKIWRLKRVAHALGVMLRDVELDEWGRA